MSWVRISRSFVLCIFVAATVLPSIPAEACDAPASMVEKARRYAQKHPVKAALITGAAVALIVGLSGGTAIAVVAGAMTGAAASSVVSHSANGMAELDTAINSIGE